MKHYEILFILKPTLTDDEVKVKFDFVKDVITKNGGEIAWVTEMGTRKLAYKIGKYERGTYFVIYFKAPTQLISELTRSVRITEEIIRFLVVKYENKQEISAWDKLSKGLKLTSKKEPKEREAREKDSSANSDIEKVEKSKTEE